MFFIFGKIFGALFGAIIAGPVGFLIGLGIGHIFDRSLKMTMHSASDSSFAQKVFFSTTFEMMGYIAKADGRVSEQEIAMARNVMANLQLDREQRMKAIQYFNLGKSPQFNWDTTMDHFIKNCGQHPQLVQLFVEIQLQGAFVDGIQYQYKRHIIERLCEKLGIPGAVLAHMEARFYAEQAFRQSRQRRQERTYQAPPPRPARDELMIAYGVLGVTSTATAQEVKKAYRKLMSQHHPDKLVSKGLPEEMIKVATEKTQNIQRAYELICDARGIT